MIKQTWKEKLHSLLNCDLKSLYPIARELDRKLYFFVGPTNSGKTYKAMQELKDADCGVYLAPLRLLALENYEYLNSQGVETSLITGEEEIINEDAGHICQTIEMVNFNFDVDVCVIDEVQMLEDSDRGWAWVNAIVGSPSKKVIMTGSVNALSAIKQIASYLQEDLEVVKFQRKNPLCILEDATPLEEVTKKTALIAFSRSEVLRLKDKLSKNHKVSVIYGNLSPEVRKEEARRFREGESEVLVATDAIAMGLNLPIKTLLFTADAKFDGISNRPLTPNEITQISGRAGRYTHHDDGYIGATSKKILKHITKEFSAPLRTIKSPFIVKATTSQIISLSKHLQTKSLYTILDYFSNHMNFTGPFIAANISYMKELAKIVDEKKRLSLEDKYMLVQAPVNTKSPLIKSAYFYYINAILNNKVVTYKPSITFSKEAKTEKELLQAEDEVKKISLYLWIAYKLPDLFPDKNSAELSREKVNHFCQNALKSGKLISCKPKPRGRKPPRDAIKRRDKRKRRR